MVNDPKWSKWILWHDSGRSVRIESRQEFSQEVLPSFWSLKDDGVWDWKRAWDAFDRQLRNYKFVKTETANVLTFKHVRRKEALGKWQTM